MVASITRGTTHTARLRTPGKNLTDKQLQITFLAGGHEIVKESAGGDITVTWDDENSASLIRVELSQEETLQLRSGAGEVQVRTINEQGRAGATGIAPFTVNRILHDGLIEWRQGDG